MTFIVGIGITCAILFMVSMSLKEEQGVLKLFIMMVIFSLMLMIPKVLGDATTMCETVVANSTDVSATVTAYEYTNFCYTQDVNTTSMFMKIVFWTYYLFVGYIITYLAWQAIVIIMNKKMRSN